MQVWKACVFSQNRALSRMHIVHFFWFQHFNLQIHNYTWSKSLGFLFWLRFTFPILIPHWTKFCNLETVLSLCYIYTAATSNIIYLPANNGSLKQHKISQWFSCFLLNFVYSKGDHFKFQTPASSQQQQVDLSIYILVIIQHTCFHPSNCTG